MGNKRHLIQFEVGNKAFAVNAAELAGVATLCPFVSYPGLPAGVSGIVQWSGRIFPVVSPFADASELDPSQCTFLFSQDELEGPFPEVAIAVPAAVRAWFPEEIDSDVTELSINELVKATAGESESDAA